MSLTEMTILKKPRITSNGFTKD